MAVTTIDDLFRDFDVEGQPSSGKHHPLKQDIRDTLKSHYEGSSKFPDNRVIRLNNANAGTPNNIVVSASVAIPAAAYQVLYVLNVTQENTGPVTVSGALNRSLVTNTSQPVPNGYLTPGMAVLCIDTGTSLRMLSYGDMETIVRESEAAQSAAEAARDIAAGYASDAVSQGNVPIYSTLTGLPEIEIPAGVNAIRVNGKSVAGDGEGGLYVSTDNGSEDIGQSGGATARSWWRVVDVDVARFRGMQADKGRFTALGGLASLPSSHQIINDGTVISVGQGAHGKMVALQKSIALGPNALGKGTMSRDNIAIGEDALLSTQSLTEWYDQALPQGTRNIGVGTNALRFNTNGYLSTAMGRNAAQCINGIGVTAYGANALGGNGVYGLSNEIENWSPNESYTPFLSAFGYQALFSTTGNGNTGIGTQAGVGIKKGQRNTMTGAQSGFSLETDRWFNGGTYVAKDISGTYSHVGNTLTLNINAHAVAVGGIVELRLTGGQSETFQNDKACAVVTEIVSVNSFRVAHPIARTTSGTARLMGYATPTVASTVNDNTAFGYQALRSAVATAQNSAFGSGALANDGSAASSCAFGYRSLSGSGTHTQCTAIGEDAGRFDISGAVQTANLTNSTAIGRTSRLSGSNQVQLGGPGTTTYAYGAVQDRSDARDKADVRDTVLGLDFINALRPVDFKWDMRDFYVDFDKDGNSIPLEKDGSKKRDRYHHGLIAQEVKEAMDLHGLDFGGYQDHSINGGDDVNSIGYNELIAPLIRAVQQLTKRLEEIERKYKSF